jgi:hypothetical protein
MLIRLCARYKAAGRTLLIANMRAPLTRKQMFNDMGFYEKGVPKDHFFLSVHSAVEYCKNQLDDAAEEERNR